MEPKRGLFAGGGTTVRLPRQLAFPAAMEFLLTAEAFPAERALELGLLNEIVEEDELLDKAKAWAARINANGPLAVRATKESVLRGLATDMRRGLQDRVRAGLRWSSAARTPRRDRRPSPRSGRRTGRGSSRPWAIDPRRPCVIGVAQLVSRPEDGPCPEPLAMWEQVVRDAAADAGADGGRARRRRQPAGRLLPELAVRRRRRAGWPTALGIDPAHRLYSGIGGTTPQVLVNDLGSAILAGDVDVGVVCGAEALDTKRRLKKAGEKPAWSHRDPEPPPFPFEAPFHPAEVAHEVFQAYLTFPLWDVARRAHLGIEPVAYRRSIGELMAPMTQVAAANPYAWFPVERTADELVHPTTENRMVGYPYTKYTVSMMDVDMAGALVLASHEAADRLGVPAEQRVYLRGWAYGCDPVYVAEHPEPWRSPAMAEVFATALATAGLGRRRPRPPRPLLLLRLLDPPRPRRAGHRARRPAGGHRDRRPAVRRRRRQRLPDPLDRRDGRRPPGRSRVGRAGDRCRHAPDQARRRRLQHRARSPDAARPRRPAGRARCRPARRCRSRTRLEGPATVLTYSVVHGRDGLARVRPGGLSTCRTAPGPTPGSTTPRSWPRWRPPSGSARQWCWPPPREVGTSSACGRDLREGFKRL